MLLKVPRKLLISIGLGLAKVLIAGLPFVLQNLCPKPTLFAKPMSGEPTSEDFSESKNEGPLRG
jgi:hypothetical protein